LLGSKLKLIVQSQRDFSSLQELQVDDKSVKEKKVEERTLYT
jgi:exonuclease III